MPTWHSSTEGAWTFGPRFVAGHGGGVGPYQAAYAVEQAGAPVLNGRVVADLRITDWAATGAGLVCRADGLWTFVAFFTAPSATSEGATVARFGVFDQGWLTPVAALDEPVRLGRGYNRFSLEFYSGRMRGEIRTGERRYELFASCPHVPFAGRVGLVKLYGATIRARDFHVHETRMSFAAMADEASGDHDFDVFLCHSGKDSDAVLEVAELLESRGLRCWLDARQIRPGDAITRKIEDGLQRSRYVVPCISENLGTPSLWVRAEYGAILMSELSGDTKRVVVPLVLDDAGPELVPLLLRDKKRVDYANKVEVEQFVQFLLTSR